MACLHAAFWTRSDRTEQRYQQAGGKPASQPHKRSAKHWVPLLLTMKHSLRFMISLITPLILQGDRGHQFMPLTAKERP